ncbi:hypothetical protein [Actinokineospora sp. HUAS TT18]|uniref:hypothetical protein n=1 Tax=Actinokineospora sp. HUAS TT18 TaxID=3447451 RepID=UPI003F52788D
MPAKRKAESEKTQDRPLELSAGLDSALARIRVGAIGGGRVDRAIAEAQPGRSRTIFDLNGAPLFHDVDLDGREGAVGVARIAASETIGSPLVSLEVRPRRWDPDAALKNAAKAATALHPKAKVVSTQLVAYCYPKVGVRVTLDDPGRKGQVELILDASDLEPVVNIGGDELEGSTAYSYYAEVVEPRLEARTRRHSRDAENVEVLRKAVPELFEQKFTLTPAITEKLASAAKFYWLLSSERVLPYAPRCDQSEDFQLRAQQTNVYCAVATGQMILDFHRWYFTQDQIATAMNTGSGGTSNPDQVAGYESLTNNSFNATYDTNALWSEAKAEIDAGRPLKSGIPGHARACDGWRKTFNLATSGYDHSVRIYDPWPWNADICQGGAVYWEDWDAVEHTNWIFVRHA